MVQRALAPLLLTAASALGVLYLGTRGKTAPSRPSPAPPPAPPQLPPGPLPAPVPGSPEEAAAAAARAELARQIPALLAEAAVNPALNPELVDEAARQARAAGLVVEAGQLEGAAQELRRRQGTPPPIVSGLPAADLTRAFVDPGDVERIANGLRGADPMTAERLDAVARGLRTRPGRSSNLERAIDDLLRRASEVPRTVSVMEIDRAIASLPQGSPVRDALVRARVYVASLAPPPGPPAPPHGAASGKQVLGQVAFPKGSGSGAPSVPQRQGPLPPGVSPVPIPSKPKRSR